MATRPVFEIGYSAPYYIEQPIDFVWNKGLNINQKRRNVIALHESYKTKFPTKHILEISSKSPQEDGLPLSAFSSFRVSERHCLWKTYIKAEKFLKTAVRVLTCMT